MQDKLLSIQEAGKLLGVSAKTLRRWEARGILTAQRTVGNQRRYPKSQIENFKSYRDLGIEDQYQSSPQDDGFAPQQSFPSSSGADRAPAPAKGEGARLRVERDSGGLRGIWAGGKGVQDWEQSAKNASNLVKKGVVIASFVLIVLVGTVTLGFALIKGVDYINYLRTPDFSNLRQFSQSTLGQQKQVLQAETTALNPTLLINIPSEFQEDAAFLGQIQAAAGIVTGGADIDAADGSVFALNLLYGVASGSGILIGTGQTPTITNTGVLTLNGSTADLTLKGSGATSISTSGSTITISSTASDGDITGVTAGTGLSGGGTSGAVSLAVALTASGTTTTTSAASGLELSSGVSLLRGCSNAQTLTWTAATSTWGCATSGGDFTLSGDSGSDQTISANNTLEVAGGTNGIDTVGVNTDTVRIDLDTTEIGTNTFGSGSAIVWTFDAGAVDSQIDFNSGSLILNEAGSDIDLRVEGDNNANLFTLDAGLFSGVGQISIGSAVQSTATAFTVIDNPAITATSNQNFYKTLIDNSSAVTITGLTTSSIVASLAIDEPNITATGTVTNASTLYISDAPTEGASGNFALWVDNGSSRFENTPVSGSTTGSALTVVPSYVVEATDLTLSGVRIALDTNSNTDAGDVAYGLNIDDITTTSGPTEYGLRIGSGYDYQMYFELGTRDLRISATAPTAGTSPLTATIPAVGADDTFCLATLANCFGGGGGTGVTFISQTTNALTKFTATSGQITSSGVTDDGTTVTVAANENLTLAAGTGSITQTYNPTGTTGTANAHSITSTFGIDVTDQTLSGIFVDANTNGNTDAGDVLNGILIDTITASSATEYGLQIGSGYDQNLYLNDTSTNILLADGGTITISDGTNTLCSIVDGGAAGNLSCTGTISAGSGADNFWNQATGALFPNNATVDLLVGATATASAEFAILNVNSGTPTASVSAVGAANRPGISIGGDGVIQSVNMGTLTLGGSTTGNIVIDSGSSSITLSDATTASSTLTVSGTLTANGTLDANGVVTLGDGGDAVTIDSNALILQTTGAGSDITLNAVDQIILSDFTTCTALETVANVLTCGTDDTGANFWQVNSGALAPGNETVDLLVGATATASAEFAILNVNSGTPTASVSAVGAANRPGISIGGDGVIQSVNMGTLTLGGTTTGNIVLDSGSSFINIIDALYLGTNESLNASLTLYSSGVGVTDPIISADSTGTLILDGPAGDVTFELAAAERVIIDGTTTANTTANGVLDLNVTSLTNSNRALDISYTHTATGATTSYSVVNAWVSSAVVTGASVSQTGYGIYNTATKTGADDATGTYSLYGLYTTASNTGRTAAGTVDTYGAFFDATGDAAGTTSVYGVYIADVSGGDTNVGLCFDCDGTYSATTVASGIQFGTDSTTTQPLRIFRSNGAAAAQITIEDAAGTDIINGSATTVQINLSAQIGGTAQRLCQGGADASAGVETIGDCGATQADLAEWYDVDDNSGAGDLVVITGNATEITTDQGKTSVAHVKKAHLDSKNGIIGVISTNPSGEVLGDMAKPYMNNPKAIALIGRTPLKVSGQSGPIAVGDPITSSSVAGVGMKATKASRVVGIALESFDTDGIGKIIVFVNPHFYDPNVYLAGDGSLIIANQGTESDPLFAVQKQEEDGSTSIVERVGAFARVVAAKIVSGALETKQLNADSLNATSSAFLTSNIKDLTVDTIRAQAIEIASKSVDLIKMDQELASISAKMEILGELGLFNGSTASNSGELTILDNLMVSGATTLADAAVLNTFSVGNNLTISPNSIDTLGTDLEIQPLGQGGVKFLGGAVTIETDGKLKVEENAEFAKDVRVGGVLSAKDIAIERAQVIDIISDTEIVATGSSGLVTLKAGEIELKVNNEVAKVGSTIFITPKTELNLPLYIKQQQDGAFVVGIKQEQLTNILFNFLIVN